MGFKPGGRKKATARNFIDGALDALGFKREDLTDDEKYRVYCGLIAKKLANLAIKSRNEKTSLDAIRELNDRILGKPLQSNINLNLDTEVKAMTNDELFSRIAEIVTSEPKLLTAIQERGVGSSTERMVEAAGTIKTDCEPVPVREGGLEHR